VPTKEINVQRFSVTSSRKFEEVVAAFQQALGHPDMNEFRKQLTAAGAYVEVEKLVHGAVGPSDLMEFTRFDLGEVVRKRNGAAAPRGVRFVVGNPIIMSQMVEHVPDAGSYAPVTVLIDQRPDGVSFVRPDGELPCSVRKFRGSESRSRSGFESRSCINGCG
jgi:uncharacterized protein (DUF302 family)